MSGATIRESIIDDIMPVACSMRYEDRIESYAQGYATPAEALFKSYNMSKYKFTVEFGGKAVAMFGLCEEGKGIANVWLLGGEGLAKMKKSFMILSREFIVKSMAEYPTLYAQVDGRYTKTHRWLKWLGAEASSEYKINGVTFNNFTFRRA